jgi:purine-binding chemotaxis protein CheW
MDRTHGNGTVELVLLTIGGVRYAIPLAAAEQALRMVALAPLPGAPRAVAGVIDFHGRPLAVFDIRRRLGLPVSTYGSDAHLLVVRTARRSLALLADAVIGVAEIDRHAVTDTDAIAPGHETLSGVAPLPDGLVLIHDVEAFLSGDDERALDHALEGLQ